MAEAANERDGDGKAVPATGTDTPAGLQRTAEGGLTLRFAFDLPKLPSIKAIPTWTHQQMINGGLVLAVALILGYAAYGHFFAATDTKSAAPATGLLRPNVATSFNPTVESPVVAPGAYVDRLASVIGNVSIGAKVFVAPFASIRGDEGQPIVIGEGSNVQDMVVIDALQTFDKGKLIDANLVTIDGKKYAVYIGSHVSLAQQSQVHGPAAVGDHTFVGMQALVFKAVVGKNVVIEPGARVIGVQIADGRYVPAGSTITTQQAADALPKITDDYPFAKLNDGVLEVNEAFADKYLEMATGTSGTAAAPATPAATGH